MCSWKNLQKLHDAIVSICTKISVPDTRKVKQKNVAFRGIVHFHMRMSMRITSRLCYIRLKTIRISSKCTDRAVAAVDFLVNQE